jgi:hypothetical protein
MAASMKCLEILERERVPDAIWERGTNFLARLGAIVDASGVPVCRYGAPYPAHADSRGFYATSVFVDSAGRTLLLAWVGAWPASRGWNCCMSPPRVLSLDAAGRVLATTGITRSRMFGRVNGEAKERSLSWLDGSMPLDLSSDGKVMVPSAPGWGVEDPARWLLN